MNKLLRLMANLGFVVTILNVNATCKLIAYQPKLPDNARKLRLF